MAERREERDLGGAGGLNNPLLDDFLLTAAAAAASGSNQPNAGNMPGSGSQQQQHQYQSWTSSFDHLSLPSAYSGWYGQPTGMNFGTGADLLSGAFPHYDDLLQATVNQGATADDPLLSKPAFYGSDGPPSTSVPTSSNMSSGTFHATQQGMGFPPPGGTTSGLGAGGGFHLGEQPAETQGSYTSSTNDFTFPNAAADGRSMYADAMNRWDMYQGSIFSAFQEPKPVDPSPWENQNLSHQTSAVTSSSDFIHSPPPPIPTPPGREVPKEPHQSIHGISNVTDQSVKNLADQLLEGIAASSTTTATTTNNSSDTASSPSPQQPSSTNTSALNSRPSYSDVAKHAKTSGSNVSKQQQKSAATDWLVDDSLPPEFPSAPVNLKPPQRQKSKSSRHSHKTKSDPESSVKPDSKYGLDVFEDVGRDKGRSHSSECSTPQSRKSSASSVTSASSGGLEDPSHQRHGDISNQHKPRNPVDAATHPKVNAYDTADVVGVVGSKYDIRKGDLKNHHKFSQGTQAHVQETRAGSASPHIDAQPKHKRPNSESAKSNQTQPKAFFDPKRIFQTHTTSSNSKQQQSGKSGGTEKSSIPNNQQPATGSNRRDRPEVLLNNGKPTSSLFAGGSVGKPSNTTYINNDLRQHKKQTNTEERNSPHRGGATDPHQDDHHHHPRRSTGGGVRGHRQDRVTSESQSGHEAAARSSSAGRRKKAEPTTTGSKKQTSGNEDRPKRRKQKDDGPNPLSVFYEWAWAAWVWLKWGVLELCYVIWNIAVILFKLFVVLVFLIVQYVVVLCGKVWSFLQRKIPFFRRFKSSGTWPGSSNHRKYGLEENITLPTTGDEAMRRLLACRGKDPYSILGVRCDASDEEIKRYYRKQAVLVHPDKNQQPGAEESFKILGAAFELVGEPEKRRKFDSHRTETQEMEDDMKQFADLLTKLQEKVQEAANLMRCENCGGKHKRFPVERAWYDARFCDKCNTRHSAKEGDVWAESRMLGFLWHYYACMEGKVYDITEWASCQKNHFKHMQANAHQVIYRIATNANKRGKGQGGSEELEDFLNQLFHHAARSDGPGAGAASSGAESPNYGAWDKDNASGSAWSRAGGGPSPPPGAAAASAGGKRRKKKRKH